VDVELRELLGIELISAGCSSNLWADEGQENVLMSFAQAVSSPRCSTYGRKSRSLNNRGRFASMQAVAMIPSIVLRTAMPRRASAGALHLRSAGPMEDVDPDRGVDDDHGSF
jgi:hypothetical protein